MNLKNLFTDDEAVSPVIGVILMVAITVILAAVIGAFVLGIGGSQEQTPQASWEVTASADGGASDQETFTLTHRGGDAIDSDQIEVTVGGESVYDSGSIQGSFANTGDTDSAWTSSSTDITAGTSLVVRDSSDGGTDANEIEDGETLNIVWNSPSSDSSSIIGSGTISL